MTEPTITADIHQALNVQLHLTAQITFNPILAVNNLANTAYLFFGQVTHPAFGVHIRFTQNVHAV
jgi:hypothetical protein